MAHTITPATGTGTAVPTVIEGYSPMRQSRNVIHDLLDGSLGVSYVAPRPRSGTLRLLFTTKAAAFAAFTLFARPTSFALTSHVPEINMTFAVDGSIDLQPNVETGEWWVIVGYQELSS